MFDSQDNPKRHPDTDVFMISDVLIKTDVAQRSAQTASTDLLSLGATSSTVMGEPGQLGQPGPQGQQGPQEQPLSFAAISQSLIADSETNIEADDVSALSAESTAPQKSTELDTRASAQAVESKENPLDSVIPPLLFGASDTAVVTTTSKPLATPPNGIQTNAVSAVQSSQTAANVNQTALTAADHSAKLEAEARTLPQASIAAHANALPSNGASVGLANPEMPAVRQDAQPQAQAAMVPSQVAMGGKVLPPAGEMLPATQPTSVAEASAQLANQVSQAIAAPAAAQAGSSLAPELRQWVHKALSDMLPAAGNDSLKSALDSVIDAGAESDLGGGMRQGEGFGKTAETSLPKLATVAPSESDWQQLVERMKVFQQPRLQQVEMTVNQEQLGRMQLQVQVHEGAIRVQFAAGQAATQEWLSQQLPGLQSELEASGLKVDSARVSEWSGGDSTQDRNGAGSQQQGFESAAEESLIHGDGRAQAESSSEADVRPESGSGMSIFA